MVQCRFRQGPLGEILTDGRAWHASGIDCRRYLDNRILNTNLQLLQRISLEVTDLNRCHLSHNAESQLTVLLLPRLDVLRVPGLQEAGIRHTLVKTNSHCPGAPPRCAVDNKDMTVDVVGSITE